MKFFEVLERFDSANNDNIYATRKSWQNEKIYLQKSSTINPEQARNEMLKTQKTNDIRILSHFDKLKDGGIAIIGWNPTSDDLFADDWEIFKITDN